MAQAESDDLTGEVRALREDLAAYRWAIERTLRRRLWAHGAVILVVICAMGTMVIGSAAILSHEASRSEATLEAAKVQACTAARGVQAQVATILHDLADRSDEDSTPPWLQDALERLAVDPCSPDGAVPSR